MSIKCQVNNYVNINVKINRHHFPLPSRGDSESQIKTAEGKHKKLLLQADGLYVQVPFAQISMRKHIQGEKNMWSLYKGCRY